MRCSFLEQKGLKFCEVRGLELGLKEFCPTVVYLRFDGVHDRFMKLGLICGC